MRDKRKLILPGLLIFSLFVSSGCALFLVGAGAAGGIAISKDTLEGNLDKKFDTVWNASRDVLMQEGFIRLENKPHGTFDAEVEKSQVNIEVKQLTEKTVRIRVKARKGYRLIPNPALANELYNKIYPKIK